MRGQLYSRALRFRVPGLQRFHIGAADLSTKTCCSHGTDSGSWCLSGQYGVAPNPTDEIIEHREYLAYRISY